MKASGLRIVCNLLQLVLEDSASHLYTAAFYRRGRRWRRTKSAPGISQHTGGSDFCFGGGFLEDETDSEAMYVAENPPSGWPLRVSRQSAARVLLNLATPTYGPDWQVRTQVQVLFPK